MSPPPRALLVVAGLVLAGALVMVFAGGWRTGVSWDETYHVLRMRNYVGDSGWYLLDGDLLGDAPGPWEDQQYVYAPMTMVLLQAWSAVWGVDPAGTVSTTAHAFAVRHLGVGLVSLVGLAGVAALARLALRRWAWGLVAAAALAAMPAWTGHAMFNVKDVPVAVGYTLVTLGCAVLAGTDRRRLLAAGAATAAAGIVLAVGTRPGIWPGLALAAGAAALLMPRGDRPARLLGLGAAIGVATVVLVLVYPAPFGSPVDALTGSVLESSKYGGSGVSRGYIPVHLVAEVPTLLLLLGGLGAVAAVRRPHRLREQPVLALVLLQAIALPLLAIARGSNLYNGLRQLLFAYPALAVLATVGIAVLAARPRLWPVGAVALVVPLAVQAQLFPYNYAYASVPAAALAPSVGERWPEYQMPTDYWRTSVRELAPEVPAGGFVLCQPNLVDGVFMRWSNDGRDNCATDVVGPLAPYDAERGGGWDAPITEFLAVTSGVDRIGENCTRIADVTRPMWWRTMTMSYVARCDLVVEQYPAGGLRPGTGGTTQLGGWTSHPSQPGIGLEGGADGVAELGWELPTWARGTDLVLLGEGLGLSGVGIEVNGTPLAVTGSGEDLRVEVPADVAAAAGQDRLLVAVSDEDGDLRLVALRMEVA